MKNTLNNMDISLAANNQTNRMKGNRNEKALVWGQGFEGRREDIIDMCFHHEIHTKRITNIITEEERNNGLKANSTEYENGKKDERNKGSVSILPENVQNNINETRRLNDDLKKKVDEISKMNALYVIKHGGKYLNVKEDSFDTSNTNNNIQLPKINEVKKYYDDLENQKAPKNFRYINDNYRAQLMRAFLNFNPIIHLNNLRNLLEKADPAIQQDINNLWQTIEKDLKEVLDPHYYRLKYKKIVAENQANRQKYSSTSNLISNGGKPSNQLNPLPLHKVSIKGQLNKQQYSIEKKKLTRKFAKDRYDLESFKECINGIMNSIKEDNIIKYIESVNANKHNSQLSFNRQFDKFFPNIKKAEEFLKNFYLTKFNKNSDYEEKNTKNLVTNHNEQIIKLIKETKNELLRGISDKEKLKNEY